MEAPLGLALDARQVGNQGRFVSEWVPPECCSTTSVLEQVAEKKGMVRKETLVTRGGSERTMVCNHVPRRSTSAPRTTAIKWPEQGLNL